MVPPLGFPLRVTSLFPRKHLCTSIGRLEGTLTKRKLAHLRVETRLYGPLCVSPRGPQVNEQSPSGLLKGTEDPALSAESSVQVWNSALYGNVWFRLRTYRTYLRCVRSPVCFPLSGPTQVNEHSPSAKVLKILRIAEPSV